MEKGNILFIMQNENGCMITYFDQYLKVFQKQVDISLKEYLEVLSQKNCVSLDSVQKGISKKYGYVQKVPILIKLDEILFFLTASLENNDCMAINYYCIHKFINKGYATLLRFCTWNGIYSIPIDYEVCIPFERRIIKNQINRCKQIDFDLKKN